MNHYVLSIKGNEWYTQIWFLADKSKDEFRDIVSELTEMVMPEIFAEGSYIGGHEIMDRILPLMEKEGFQILKPELEIDLRGEIFYSPSRNDIDRKPDFMSDQLWSQILEHNQKVHDRVFDKPERGLNEPDKTE